MSPARTFVAADYAVFAVMLVLSASIGIFYAFRDRKSNRKTLGYLLANRSMTVFPVAISLALSFQSSLTILAIPAEVYIYGTMIFWVNLIYPLISVITAEAFIPTFYRLEISSTYEYLELRFNKAARVLGTLVFIVSSIFYSGIIMYGPALAFEAVTGFQLWAAIISTGLVCTFYTALGGLRGVIWTDVFQGFIILAGMLAVLIKGSMELGGFSNIWRTAERGERIDFVHFETDVRIRNTVWSIVIGGTIRFTGLYAVSQSQVQRYLSCKSEKQAKLSVYLNTIGVMLIFTLAFLSGLVIYAYYESCDPLRSKCVKRHDQLMPYMLLEMFQDYPGLAGLFVSAVYAGSISSLSSSVNAMATVTTEDMVKPVFKERFSDQTYSWISKGVVILFGFLCIGMSFVLSTTEELLQAAFSFLGMTMGPLVGLFTLGIHFPFANSIGAISGLLSGLAAAIWFYVGRKQITKSNELIRRLPLIIDTCSTTCDGNTVSNLFNATVFDATWNYTTAITSPLSTTGWMESTSTASGLEDVILTSSKAPTSPSFDDDVPFYTVSYHYISAIGLGFCLAVDIVVSLATCGWKQRKEVDTRLLRPPFDHWTLRSCLPEKVRKFLRFGIDWEDNTKIRNEELSMNEIPMAVGGEPSFVAGIRNPTV